jgi:hypothetical protein
MFQKQVDNISKYRYLLLVNFSHSTYVYHTSNDEDVCLIAFVFISQKTDLSQSSRTKTFLLNVKFISRVFIFRRFRFFLNQYYL